MLFVADVDLSELPMEANGVGGVKSDIYDFEERAGRLSALAALWSSGDVVEEKLYGTELVSIGWTWAVRILTFSSTKVACQKLDVDHNIQHTWEERNR